MIISKVSASKKEDAIKKRQKAVNKPKESSQSRDLSDEELKKISGGFNFKNPDAT